MSSCSWRLAATLGLRFARSRRRSGFVSFITASSIVGIAIGVMALIVGLSAMNGFERELKNRVLDVIPHAMVEGSAGVLPDFENYETELLKSEHIVGTAPFIMANALLERRNSFRAMVLKGIDPGKESHISTVGKYIESAKLDTLTPGSDYIIMGKSLAEEYGLSLGDHITLAVTNQSSDGNIGKMNRHSFEIKGYLNTGGQIDSGLLLIHIDDARRLTMFPQDAVSGIGVKTDDFYHALDLLYSQAKKIGKRYVYLSDWKLTNGHLYDDIQLIRLVIYIALFIVICVASFNIVSGLMMALNDKRSSVAILVSMGASPSFIRKIFVSMGMVNGLTGIITGLLLGYLVSNNLKSIFSVLEKVFGFKLLNKDLYFIDFIPSELHLMDFGVVSLGALFICYLSTLYPAWRAGRINPAVELMGR